MVGIEIPYSAEKDKIDIQFHDDRLLVNFPLPKGEGEYHLDLTLFKKINWVKSTHFLRVNSIEIVMEKKSQELWESLRRDGLGIPEVEQKSQLSYPSSSRVKHNWDKLDNEIKNDKLEHYEEYGIDAEITLY